jgi:dihydroflavonol-4-reductase
MAERIAGVTGREPFATVDGLNMAKKKMWFSPDKAVRELGYEYRPAEQAITDAAVWFEENGYLK